MEYNLPHFVTLIDYIGYMLKNLFRYIWVKGLGVVIVPLLGFLFGYQLDTLLEALFALIVIDFITGVISAYKTGVPIQSRLALRSAIKLGVYGLLVSSAHLTEVAVPGTTFLDEGMIAFLATTEMISIIENAGRMGYAIPQRLLNQLQSWRDSGVKPTT